MLRCTYIVLIYNHEGNILNLVSSLKKISGNFRKEFIFIDDGSTDDSLGVLKSSVNDLSRTTIITQDSQGPSLSINKALNLATGDYIHFVEGDEVLHPDSSTLLIDACLKFGVQVAIGHASLEAAKYNQIEPDSEVIDTPINAILANKLPIIRQVGRSGSLVHSDLLEKIDKADSSIYTQNMSLSLRCAKYSKFVHIKSVISTISKSRQSSESKFESYNNLRSIYNFVKSNPELFSNLIPDLLRVLSVESLDKSKKAGYSIKSWTSKYIKSTTLDKVLEFYKQEFDKLF